MQFAIVKPNHSKLIAFINTQGYILLILEGARNLHPKSWEPAYANGREKKGDLLSPRCRRFIHFAGLSLDAQPFDTDYTFSLQRLPFFPIVAWVEYDLGEDSTVTRGESLCAVA